MGGMNFHGGGLLGFDMRTQLSSELDLVFAKNSIESLKCLPR